jgi:hypothetical protein
MKTTMEAGDSISTHSRPAWRVLIVIALLVAVISRFSHFLRPMEGDGPVFIYMGRVVAEGGRWGQDIVDNKFPTVGLMASFCWRIFGAYWPAYVVLGAAMSAGATLALTRAARRNFDPHAARATLLFSLVYLNFSWIVWIYGGFQLETPLAFFASIGAMAALETLRKGDSRDAFTLGLSAGTAALLKPTGLSIAAAFAVAMVFSQLSWRHVIKLSFATALGVLIPLGVGLTYLIATHTLQEIPATYREISMYAANSAWDWRSDFGKPLVILFLAGFPMLVRGWIARRGRHEERSSPEARQRSMLVFVLAWLALETMGIAAQRRMYGYHFLVMAPPLALLFGWLPRRVTIRSMAVALAPVLVLSILGTYQIFAAEGVGPRTLAVSEYLKTHASANDRVWSDSTSRVLLETGLKPGSRCVLTFLFANSDQSPLRYSDIILKDFQSEPPRFVILDADMPEYVEHQATHVLEYERFPVRRENFLVAWDRIEAFVKENYVVDTTIGKENVWRLRDDAVAKRNEKPTAQPWAFLQD